MYSITKQPYLSLLTYNKEESKIVKRTYKFFTFIIILYTIINVLLFACTAVPAMICKEEITATPLYADKNNMPLYDVKVTYMYQYDGKNYMGSDYDNKKNLESMKNSQIRIWVNKSNPNRSIMHKKGDLCVFFLVNIIFGSIWLIISGKDGKKKAESPQT